MPHDPKSHYALLLLKYGIMAVIMSQVFLRSMFVPSLMAAYGGVVNGPTLNDITLNAFTQHISFSGGGFLVTLMAFVGEDWDWGNGMPILTTSFFLAIVLAGTAILAYDTQLDWPGFQGVQYTMVDIFGGMLFFYLNSQILSCFYLPNGVTQQSKNDRGCGCKFVSNAGAMVFWSIATPLVMFLMLAQSHDIMYYINANSKVVIDANTSVAKQFGYSGYQKGWQDVFSLFVFVSTMYTFGNLISLWDEDYPAKVAPEQPSESKALMEEGVESFKKQDGFTRSNSSVTKKQKDMATLVDRLKTIGKSVGDIGKSARDRLGYIGKDRSNTWYVGLLVYVCVFVGLFQMVYFVPNVYISAHMHYIGCSTEEIKYTTYIMIGAMLIGQLVNKLMFITRTFNRKVVLITAILYHVCFLAGFAVLATMEQNVGGCTSNDIILFKAMGFLVAFGVTATNAFHMDIIAFLIVKEEDPENGSKTNASATVWIHCLLRVLGNGLAIAPIGVLSNTGNYSGLWVTMAGVSGAVTLLTGTGIMIVLLADCCGSRDRVCCAMLPKQCMGRKEY